MALFDRDQKSRKVRSHHRFDDGHLPRWRYRENCVSLSHDFPNRIELVIDDEDKGQEQSGSTSIPDTAGALVLGHHQFKGCVSNLYTRR